MGLFSKIGEMASNVGDDFIGRSTERGRAWEGYLRDRTGESRLKPYAVYTGRGALTFDKGGYTYTPSGDTLEASKLFSGADSRARIQSLLEGNGESFVSTAYNLLKKLGAPQEQQDRLDLENRLFQQGMLGSTGGQLRTQALYDSQGQTDLARQLSAFDLREKLLSGEMSRFDYGMSLLDPSGIVAGMSTSSLGPQASEQNSQLGAIASGNKTRAEQDLGSAKLFWDTAGKLFGG